MAVHLIGQRAMNTVVSHHASTQAKIHEETEAVAARAEANLAAANSSLQVAGADPGTPHSIDTSYGDVDGFVNLNGENPVALEFGHQPSGAFGPGGRFAHIKSKAPEGRYILSRAGGLV